MAHGKTKAARAAAAACFGVVLLAAACSPGESVSSSQIAQSSTTGASGSPPATEPTTSPPATMIEGTTGSEPDPQPADKVFINARVVTIDPAHRFAQAVAVVGERISFVGTSEAALAYVGPETVLFDLDGRALLPGFVDAHNHIFWNADSTPEAIEEAQQYLLISGVTSIGDAAVGPGRIANLRAADERGDLRVRTSHYPVYNTKCDGTLQEDWFLRFAPEYDESSKVRILGIKIFADAAGNLGEPCGWAEMSVELPPEFIAQVGGDPFGESLLSPAEMAEVIVRNQERGYQVIIHARGDITVENALTAYEIALDGAPNTYRHRIDHNDFIRPDQLSRYGEIGVVPLVRGRPSACVVNDNGGVHRFGEAVHPWFYPIRSLIEANPDLQVAWHSDTIFVAPRRPAVEDLLDLVTRRAIRRTDGEVCEPSEWLAAEVVSVDDALRLMTINGAYALFLDEQVGSIEPGKFADLIVLSGDPHEVDPATLGEIEVQLTMVGGQVEHCILGELCEGTPGGDGLVGGSVAASLEELGPRGCDDLTCYDLAVACAGLPARGVTVQARHLNPAAGTVIFVGGGDIMEDYGEILGIHELGYDTYSITFPGENGYFTGVEGAGFEDMSCATTDVIGWIIDNLAERPDAVAAHGISAGANQLGYGLAAHGLGDLVDVVVFASGPIHATLEDACFAFSTPQRAESIDRAYGWEGDENYCLNGEGPDSAHEILRRQSIVTSEPGAARSYHYEGTSVVFLLGGDDDGPLAATEPFYDRIGTEKSWIVLDGVGHEIVLDPAGADAIRTAIIEGLIAAQ